MVEKETESAARNADTISSKKSERSSSNSIKTGMTALVAVAVILSILGLIGLLSAFKIKNPFGTEKVDRSPAVLLNSITDLSRFEAASGSFQVIVDVEEDTKFVPSVISGQRTLFLAQGTVAGYVDFSELKGSNLKVDQDKKTVEIKLPEAVLDSPKFDASQSRVISRDRGILNRVGGLFSDSPTSEADAYAVARERATAAANKSDLKLRTENNAKEMLTSLMKNLGYETVNISYEKEIRP